MYGIEQHKVLSLNHILNSFSKAVQDNDFKSAVAIICKNNKVLLGKSKSKDERLGKYCFPGGRIDKDESVYKAAVREAEEESGVICVPRGAEVVRHEDLKDVGFVFCDYISGAPRPNWEFEDMKWFDVGSLPEEILERNLSIIEQYLL